jgi:hypothetical protein
MTAQTSIRATLALARSLHLTGAQRDERRNLRGPKRLGDLPFFPGLNNGFGMVFALAEYSARIRHYTGLFGVRVEKGLSTR